MHCVIAWVQRVGKPEKEKVSVLLQASFPARIERMSNDLRQHLEVDADQALFSGKINGIVATCYLNERPLAGLAGILDWRFHGMISDCIRTGVITGKEGECVYLPVTRQGVTLHVILAGAGHSEQPGLRGKLPEETLQALEKNLASLKLAQIGISRSDLGEDAEQVLGRHFKQVPLCVVR
jgi:hypothetical protein